MAHKEPTTETQSSRYVNSENILLQKVSVLQLWELKQADFPEVLVLPLKTFRDKDSRVGAIRVCCWLSCETNISSLGMLSDVRHIHLHRGIHKSRSSDRQWTCTIKMKYTKKYWTMLLLKLSALNHKNTKISDCNSTVLITLLEHEQITWAKTSKSATLITA